MKKIGHAALSDNAKPPHMHDDRAIPIQTNNAPFRLGLCNTHGNGCGMPHRTHGQEIVPMAIASRLPVFIEFLDVMPVVGNVTISSPSSKSTIARIACSRFIGKSVTVSFCRRYFSKTPLVTSKATGDIVSRMRPAARAITPAESSVSSLIKNHGRHRAMRALFAPA